MAECEYIAENCNSSRCPKHGVARMCLADPVGQIERECSWPEMKQSDVALTYALAMRDEDLVAVDWTRVNAAIRKRWPKGLDRVKRLAWKHFKPASQGNSEEGNG